MIIKPTVEFKLPGESRGALKGFLESVHGKNVMEALSLSCPETLSTSIEQAALTGQLKKGYELALENMLFLIAPPDGEIVATPVSAYPELGDDKAWEEDQARMAASEKPE